MPFTGFRRWTQLGSTQIASGDANNLINTNAGSVEFDTQGDIVELSVPKASDASGNILGFSDEIPLGSKITGIQCIYPLGFSATVFPAEVTTKALIKLSDLNASTVDSVVTSQELPLRMRTFGGENNLLGLDIDPFNNTAFDFIKFQLSLSNLDTSQAYSADFKVRTAGQNFGVNSPSSLGPGPYPAVRVFYRSVRVAVTNPTRVVLNNNKRVHIGYTSGSSFNFG